MSFELPERLVNELDELAQADAQIAAIARSRSATLVSRNTSDFEGCGIDLVNP